jgi:hypothetical protein
MADTQIDRYPVKELPGRYSINRSVLYSRLKALNIQPHSSGKQSFVTGEELHLLNKLHEHLKRGGLLASFLPNRQLPDNSKTIRQTFTRQNNQSPQ